MKFLFVGTNLFSTTLLTGDDDDGMIRFDTTKPYMGRLFKIVIKYASGFQLNDLNTMRMEDHPMALNFINSIVKSGLRASKLV